MTGQNIRWSVAFLTLAFMVAAAHAAAIAPPVDDSAGSQISTRGAALYRTNCASCHGVSARGDGPMAEVMRQRPSDLTNIRRRHHGAFPRDLVARIIDGREVVRGHGGAGMPVWGDAFIRSGAEIDAAAVRQRIKELVDYLEGIQSRDTHD
jgi:mono/diheme cytochrome c family protein